jgi:hypothetical protein
MGEGASIAVPATVMDDMLNAVMASGGSFGEALGHAIAVFGFEEESVRKAWTSFIGGKPKGNEVMVALDEIAKTDPGTADEWLQEALASGKMREWTKDGSIGLHFKERAWITALPDGLEVDGGLFVRDCIGLKRLPDGLSVSLDFHAKGCVALDRLPEGLTVGGWLGLVDCKSIVSLPERMTIGKSLNLEGC